MRNDNQERKEKNIFVFRLKTGSPHFISVVLKQELQKGFSLRMS